MPTVGFPSHFSASCSDVQSHFQRKSTSKKRPPAACNSPRHPTATLLQDLNSIRNFKADSNLNPPLLQHPSKEVSLQAPLDSNLRAELRAERKCQAQLQRSCQQTTAMAESKQGQAPAANVSFSLTAPVTDVSAININATINHHVNLSSAASSLEKRVAAITVISTIIAAHAPSASPAQVVLPVMSGGGGKESSNITPWKFMRWSLTVSLVNRTIGMIFGTLITAFLAFLVAWFGVSQGNKDRRYEDESVRVVSGVEKATILQRNELGKTGRCTRWESRDQGPSTNLY